MKIILSTLKKILFWSYERGSWQYDVMCVLILAFIFLSPNSLFESRRTATSLLVRGNDIRKIDPDDIAVMDHRRRQKYANALSISRIEKAEAHSGDISYIALRKTFDEAQFVEKQHETK